MAYVLRPPPRPSETRWIALAEGVEVEVRPFTTALSRHARAWSDRVARALREERRAALESGAGWDGPDFDDEDALRGLVDLLYLKGLARAAIAGWRGVDGADGAPAPFSAEAVSTLMEDAVQADAFELRYVYAAQSREPEKNASAPAPNGTSAAGAGTAAPAATPGSPAPAASPD